jgi:predicted ribosome quality control (RQC) complex YloA/Tae2 family protein
MITHRGGVCSQPGVSAALETFYRARQDVTAHHQHRQHIVQQLDETRQRLEHQRSQLEIEQERARELETMRWEGEMLFAFLHTITPGQTVLEVEGHQIKLDPERTPVECAQRRFRAYEKAKSGLEHISARLRETENRLAGVEQLCVLMEVADSREQIDQIAQEAEEQGYIGKDGRAQQRGGKPQGKARDSGKKKKKPRAPRLKPLHLVSSDGFDLYVGRSATQNDEVTFRIGRPDDLWLHVRGIPGAHVIIRSGGHDVPERTLHEAGGLAAYFSRARTETMVDVEVARRKHVRRVSGGPPGLVTYRVEQTVRVAPTPPWGT